MSDRLWIAILLILGTTTFGVLFWIGYGSGGDS